MQFLTLLDRLLANKTSLGLLVLRIAIGVVFIAHGGQKLFVNGIAATADGFAGLGIPFPFPNAVAATFVELVGGLLILVGLLTRWSSIPVAFTMVVAFAMVHGKNGFFMQTGGFEYVAVLFLGAIALLFTGAGKYSLDHALLGVKDPDAN